MKVSEITVDHVAEFIRADDYDSDQVKAMLESAKAFVRSYTDLTDEEVDSHEEFYTAVMVLCQDMYDNRVLYVEKSNLNKVVDSILGMHRKNLL